MKNIKKIDQLPHSANDYTVTCFLSTVEVTQLAAGQGRIGNTEPGLYSVTPLFD